MLYEVITSHQDQVVALPPGAQVIARITSYNVCYTKLLRFTGDWGFQAEPVFAAMQTRISTEAEGDAWIARLNDVPRYFAENVANMRVITSYSIHYTKLYELFFKTPWRPGPL